MNLNRNVYLVYSISSLTMFLIIMPMLWPYFNSKGLNMQEFIEIQAIFSFVFVAMEIPSGYLSDMLGRKMTYILGLVFVSLGWGIFLFVESYWGFVLYEVVLGIGLSLISGTDISLLFDSLNEKQKMRSSYYFSNINFFRSASEASSAIVASFVFVQLGFPGIKIIQLLMSILALFFAFFLIEPSFEKMSKESHIGNLKEIFKLMFINSRFLRLICINFVLWGLSTFILVWLIQKHWELGNISVKDFGWMWAIVNISVAISAKLAPKLETNLGPQNALITMGLIPILGFFLLSKIFGIWSLAIISIFQITRGISQVVIKNSFNKRIDSKHRATANSINNFLFRGLFCLVGPLIGYFVDKDQMIEVMQSLGVFYLFVFIFFLTPLIKNLESFLECEAKDT